MWSYAGFLDLIVVLLWPLVLSAAAWAIVINALAETDEISKVVESLDRPNGLEVIAKHGNVSLRRSKLSAIASGDGGWFQVISDARGMQPLIYQGRKAGR